MPIKFKLSILLAFCLGSFHSPGQNNIRGRLTTSDSTVVDILNVLPDSFPTISIVFKAHQPNGEPIWILKKEDFKVFENGEESVVKSLTPISRNKPINIAIVIDHSGSMFEDPSLLYDKEGRALFSFDPNTFELVLPKGYVSPLDNAKTTTMEFVSSFNFKKDFISIIGFSSSVDRILTLTNVKHEIDSVINSMQADSLTALYDAMLAGLNQLNTDNGVNVLVTLTDGQNNKSNASWKDVIARANSLDIPIYIIGLGNVNQDTLQTIADSTKGQFIYTETSRSFREIYSRLSKEIQSFYDLKYASENLSSIESKRKLTIKFLHNEDDRDTVGYDFALPEEVKVYLRNRRRRMNYSIGTSVITAIAVTSGTIIYRRRRRRHASH